MKLKGSVYKMVVRPALYGRDLEGGGGATKDMKHGPSLLK